MAIRWADRRQALCPLPGSSIPPAFASLKPPLRAQSYLFACFREPETSRQHLPALIRSLDPTANIVFLFDSSFLSACATSWDDVLWTLKSELAFRWATGCPPDPDGLRLHRTLNQEQYDSNKSLSILKSIPVLPFLFLLLLGYNETRHIARAFARLVLKIQKFACRYIFT